MNEKLKKALCKFIEAVLVALIAFVTASLSGCATTGDREIKGSVEFVIPFDYEPSPYVKTSLKVRPL